MTLTLTPETEARLLAVAARQNQAPEAVVDAAIERLWQQEPLAGETVPDAGESEQGRQERLHALIDDLITKAHETAPEPYASPARTYYRESEAGKIIAEKFRKQGFQRMTSPEGALTDTSPCSLMSSAAPARPQRPGTGLARLPGGSASGTEERAKGGRGGLTLQPRRGFSCT